jgi:hypothetical protein
LVEDAEHLRDPKPRMGLHLTPVPGESLQPVHRKRPASSRIVASPGGSRPIKVSRKIVTRTLCSFSAVLP